MERFSGVQEIIFEYKHSPRDTLGSRTDIRLLEFHKWVAREPSTTAANLDQVSRQGLERFTYIQTCQPGQCVGGLRAVVYATSHRERCANGSKRSRERAFE